MLPLSQSPVWQQQRAFYEDNASEAFAEIPHEAVDNPWVAAAYARVIEAFLRDQPAERVQIVELGAGAGRFAHGLARELRHPFTYTLTDFAESQLEDWRGHEGLEGFEFARVDLTGEIALDVEGPLVVIANYVFDSLPVDAFAVDDGALSECVVDEDFRFTRRPARPYGDPDLDALLEHYATALDDTVFTVPDDRDPRAAAAARARRRPPARARRRQGAQHRGGARLPRGARARAPQRRLQPDGQLPRARPLRAHATAASCCTAATGTRRSTSARWCSARAPTRRPPTRTRSSASARATSRRSRAGVERAAEHLSVAEIVALLRLSGWDATTLHAVLGPLRDQAAEADPATQEDLRQALFETYDRHFAVPGDPDLPFAIGLLLYELQDYEDAIEFFEASLEQHGHDPATERNIELCEAMLG